MSLGINPPTRVIQRAEVMGAVFQIGNNRYRVSARDIQAITIIQRIAQETPSDVRPAWLLRYRAEVAYITEACPRAAITQLALTTTDRNTFKLALWFRGRCKGALGASQLLRRALAENQELRIHTARCLYAMGAWAQLRELTASLPDSLRSRRFLSNRPSRPFASRLKRYLSHTPQRALPADPTRLFMDFRTTSELGKPAKPVWLIRLVLDRIRFLVSARYSVDRLPTQFYDEAS